MSRYESAKNREPMNPLWSEAVEPNANPNPSRNHTRMLTAAKEEVTA